MSEKKPSATGRKSQPASSSSGGPMDMGLLEQLVKLMAANDLNTVAIRDGDRRVVLKRGATQALASPMTYHHHASPSPAPSSAPAPAQAASDSGKGAAATDDAAGLVAIKSPMVGTYYASPSPDAKAFVQVGSTVDEDSDVCIIEAMKVFNNIKAETRGTITKVLVTNGQTVEFGQTLFLVKP